MIVMQVQMWPKGDKSKAYSLGTLTIALEDINDKGLRAYSWSLTKFRDKGRWKSGAIAGHNPRVRGPWDLIFRILREAVGRRNPG